MQAPPWCNIYINWQEQYYPADKLHSLPFVLSTSRYCKDVPSSVHTTLMVRWEHQTGQPASTCIYYLSQVGLRLKNVSISYCSLPTRMHRHNPTNKHNKRRFSDQQSIVLEHSSTITDNLLPLCSGRLLVDLPGKVSLPQLQTTQYFAYSYTAYSQYSHTTSQPKGCVVSSSGYGYRLFYQHPFGFRYGHLYCWMLETYNDTYLQRNINRISTTVSSLVSHREELVVSN